MQPLKVIVHITELQRTDNQKGRLFKPSSEFPVTVSRQVNDIRGVLTKQGYWRGSMYFVGSQTR